MARIKVRAKKVCFGDGGLRKRTGDVFEIDESKFAKFAMEKVGADVKVGPPDIKAKFEDKAPSGPTKKQVL